MAYKIIESNLSKYGNTAPLLLDIFKSYSVLIEKSIDENQFWNLEQSNEYIGTRLDQRKLIEPELLSLLSELSASFLLELLVSHQINSQSIHLFLPRLLTTLPLKDIPSSIINNYSLNKSGFLNPFVNSKFSYFSFFSDHPPHIDLIDFPDFDNSKQVFTCLIPLTSSISPEVGGLYLSEAPWSEFPAMSIRRKTIYPPANWSSLFLDQFQPIVWNQIQPHTLGYNKKPNMVGFFRFCFCQDLENIPNLRSPTISINLPK
tara:strand:+ start:2737 stop:3516 length:780 start_codon:yes stop_codon:yes gene_type:complete